MCIYIYTNIYTHRCVYIYTHTHKIQSYVYIYIYIYIYICIEIINPIHTTIPLQKRPKGFSALQVMFSWISFNATFPRENTVDEANVWYNRWQAFKAGRMGRCLNQKLLGDWNMAGWNDFPTILWEWNVIIPTNSIIFRGRYTSQIKSMGTHPDFRCRFWAPAVPMVPPFRVWMGSSNQQRVQQDPYLVTIYPLVNIQKTMENHHFSWVNLLFHFYGQFSIAFCMFTRPGKTFCAPTTFFFGVAPTSLSMVPSRPMNHRRWIRWCSARTHMRPTLEATKRPTSTSSWWHRTRWSRPSHDLEVTPHSRKP